MQREQQKLLSLHGYVYRRERLTLYDHTPAVAGVWSLGVPFFIVLVLARLQSGWAVIHCFGGSQIGWVTGWLGLVCYFTGLQFGWVIISLLC
jgi:hypothetical protein